MPMPAGILTRLASAGLLALAVIGPANAMQLITRQEAALPNDEPSRAGITRGPKVVLVNPAATAGFISSPFNLRIRFDTFGRTKVDVDSIVVTYKKRPAIDLTQRIKSFIQPTGINLDGVLVPPGEHRIRIDLKDTDDQSGFTEFTLKVH
jgi:hypothetical protein